MKTIDVVQGSQEWHAHRAWPTRNASDAPAMMGVSPYKSRSDLIRECATGVRADVTPATQRIFDAGHALEAGARPRAEAIIGEELYPVTGTLGKYSASFDGLTIGEDICWEHKTLSDVVRVCQSAADLPTMYRMQMEQQLMVSGAGKCLFTATAAPDADGVVEEKVLWYESDPDLRAQIIAGWEQFAQDVDDYVHVEVLPPATATPVMALPALSIQVTGSIALVDNLALFGARLGEFISGLDKNPSSDQAFADAEAAIGTLKSAQEALEAAEASALAQTASIDEMRRTVALYAGQARSTRLMLEKLVKTRKETIRIEIIQAGKDAFSAHVAGLVKRLGKPYLPVITPDFAGAIKGKKTVASVRDAVDGALARAKLEANALADKVQINMGTLADLAGDHKFLFSDAASLVLKENDDLVALVKMRIADHQAAEAKRIEAERERIRAEEVAKLEREAAEKNRFEAAQTAEAVRWAKEQDAKREALNATASPILAQLPTQERTVLTPSNHGVETPTRMQIVVAVADSYRVHTDIAEEWIVERFS